MYMPDDWHWYLNLPEPWHGVSRSRGRRASRAGRPRPRSPGLAAAGHFGSTEPVTCQARCDRVVTPVIVIGNAVTYLEKQQAKNCQGSSTEFFIRQNEVILQVA